MTLLPLVAPAGLAEAPEEASRSEREALVPRSARPLRNADSRRAYRAYAGCARTRSILRDPVRRASASDPERYHPNAVSRP